MKLTLVYFITVTLFATACCQTCSLTNIISSAGAFTYTQQSNEGFCRELVVGPVNSLMVYKIFFFSISIFRLFLSQKKDNFYYLPILKC